MTGGKAFLAMASWIKRFLVSLFILVVGIAWALFANFSARQSLYLSYSI
ncbi:hypothetical protein PF010_g25109 [Phytophthora fragariae]|uniref:Uncharacterized protein n=1 Tax=Phytophthora fragariae TaxID=53985 RepID=A0A6G0K1J3_9STRA|nr:hypothetical protein PF010_g25109 [Phytophthora fragariae]